MSDLCKRKIFKNERSDNRESGRLGKWGKDGKTFRGWFFKILFKFGRNKKPKEIKLAFCLKNQSKSFSFWDFTTFGLLLVVSTIIGIYFGWKDRKNKDDNNYGKF